MILVHTSPFVGCDLKVGLFIWAQGVSAAIGMQSVFVSIEKAVFFFAFSFGAAILAFEVALEHSAAHPHRPKG
jgi:surfactin synthase thioesterase subunit